MRSATESIPIVVIVAVIVVVIVVVTVVIMLGSGAFGEAGVVEVGEVERAGE